YIPYPAADDRREILRIYDRKMRLRLTPEALEYAVRRTGDYVPGAAQGTRYSGDHLSALCRAVARIRLREHRGGPSDAALVERALKPTGPEEIDRALTEWVEAPQ